MSGKGTELMDQKHQQLGHEESKSTPQGRKDTFRDRKAETLLGKRKLRGLNEYAFE